MPVRERFDPERDFTAARGFTFKGTPYVRGDAFPKDSVDSPRQLRMLYDSRSIDHTAEDADPEDDKGVTYEATGGGWYEVKAPWLDDPIRVKGKVPTRAKVNELRESGEPETHHGVTLRHGEGAWWTISRPGVAEVLKVQGEDKARYAAATLRAGGEVEGAPLDPVAVEPGAVTTDAEGKWFVTAPWIAEDDREAFDDEQAAAQRADEVRRAGPPEDYVPVPVAG